MYSIKDLNLLGKGTQKLVFEHIESPDKVIKIIETRERHRRWC